MDKARIEVVAETGGFNAKVKMKLKLLSWNVRGANNLDKRKIISNFVKSQRVDLVCVQETKIRDFSNACVKGTFHDWKALEAEGSTRYPYVLGQKKDRPG